ncbi:Clp protease ClpP [Alkalihalophilus marmarensis]|jgi:ATP-dependent protease ClpP protease subunit|uniref:head maturation protease, ClpP-related n=1 Tax=Alkalihalophilus marmarensis TaxID=521377 RepID=UPI00203A443D|nr:head maturation protease, ClpP-related [Alkalihalophilus marmarensis]MCM3487890.1 Clp protease ClpP [Alkalihalophilus marmarensis]
MKKMSKEDFFSLFKNQSYVAQLKEIPQKFNVVHNEETKTSEITIYGVIGTSWWSDSFSASDMDNALNEAGNNDVTVRLNSPGGDAFMGIAIYNRLRRHNGKVTIFVDGWACSAASVIAMAADELVMGLGSMLMIHEASNIVWGTKSDMRKEASVLDELEEGIIDIYMTKANVSREEIRQNVDAETWYSAKKALEVGFANKVEGSSKDDPSNEAEQPGAEEFSNEQKSQILNELKNVLNPNDPAPVQSKRNRVFF